MNQKKKKKPNYYTPFRRVNFIKRFFATIFLGLCSWPRLVLEVPLRRNLGQRYFSLFSALGLVLLLAAGPYFTLLDWRYVLGIGPAAYGHDYGIGYNHRSLPEFSIQYLYYLYPAWYWLLGLWTAAAIWRRIEIARYERDFDLERYSLSSGNIYRIFYNPWILRFSLKEGQLRLGSFKVGFLNRTFTIYVSLVRVYVTTRTVETFIEPLFGLIVGYFIRIFLSETAGYMVQGCSIVYSLSSFASYYEGDEFVMDKIDEMIANADLERNFVDLDEVNPASGFRFIGKKPVDKDRRRRLLQTIVRHDDEEDDDLTKSAAVGSNVPLSTATTNGKTVVQAVDDEV